MLLARGVSAQGWTPLPNGSFGYSVSYVTSGFFSCGRYIAGDSCFAQGNTLTLLNGGNQLVLTYEGTSETVQPSTKPGQHVVVSLGRITKTFTGSGPFIPPRTPSPLGSYIGFGVSFQQTWPYSAVGRNFRGMHARGGTFRVYGGGTMDVGDVSYSHLTNPTWAYDDFDPVELSATAAVAPEPLSLVLVATGLVGIGGIVRRRGKRG
jgi:hypothetical protein